MVEIGEQNYCEARASPSDWLVECIYRVREAMLTWLFLEIKVLILIRRLA